MKTPIILISVSLFLVSSILVWIATIRFNDFNDYHRSIAHESTKGVSSEVSRFVNEKKRLVRLFAEQYSEKINLLANNKDDPRAYESVNELMMKYFPKNFSFNVASTEGEFIIDDFDGEVGRLCREDLKLFIEHDIQLPRIHPVWPGYHFDILAPVPGYNLNLFVSFHADILGNIVGNAQAIGHQLLLVRGEKEKLIEASSSGARINIIRDNYHMNDEEVSRVLSSNKVNDSSWIAIDLYDQELFNDFKSQVVKQSLGLFFVYSVFVFVMFIIMRKQNKLRLEAENHKNNFLSVISHELRTPLTSISASLSLIYNGITSGSPEKSKELLAIAVSNCGRLNMLVNDLLDIQKMEAGKMSLTKNPLPINNLVKECIEANMSYANQLGKCFEFLDWSETVMVNVDKDRLYQVILNLLSNAAKYGGKDDTICISMDCNNNIVRLNVTDHGDGIPEEFRSRIFTKFCQADNGNTRKSTGTGLGLSIVKEIIELHGGSVGFESKPGRGSTFHFELPIFKAA